VNSLEQQEKRENGQSMVAMVAYTLEHLVYMLDV
jgi:hypothetical protein